MGHVAVIYHAGKCFRDYALYVVMFLSFFDMNSQLGKMTNIGFTQACKVLEFRVLS